MVLLKETWRYVASMRLSRLVSSLFFIAVIILTTYYLAKDGALLSSSVSSTIVPSVDAESEKVKAYLEAQSDIAHRALGLISEEEWRQASELCPAVHSEVGPDFKKRLEELLRVKHSVQVELRGLEKQRTTLQVEREKLNVIYKLNN